MITENKLVTYDDYLNLGDDGKQYEIIGGELNMTPSPTFYHQIISGNLYKELERYVSKKNLGKVVYAPFDVVLSMIDVVQPDLMFISKENIQSITEKNIVKAPDLTIEIISESTKTKDQAVKKNLYEKYGVKEYWIVWPDEKKVEQFILQDQKLELRQSYKKSESLNCEIIEGFSIEFDKVFED